MKRVFATLILSLSMLIAGCSSSPQQEVIKINGELEETIEVYSEYNDKGVTFPEDKYSLIVEGAVNNSYLGRYELKYSIYSKDGELEKELHRFVNVVDTTAPTFVKAQDTEFYAGITYDLSSFVTEYSDNYYKKDDINVSKTSFVFKTPGVHEVEIVFKDKSDNAVTFKKTIEVTLDPIKLIDYIYKNQSSKVTTGTTGIGSSYTSVQIDSNRSFTYYHGSTMHYLEKVSSSLGSYASIQISAEYGSFNNANINYHISGSGGTYSTGFANIDATAKSVTVSSFRSVINNLGLDESVMLAELNSNLPTVLSHFQYYFENTLNLELK